MKEINHDQSIDITREICPMTFVKTKLKLEKMDIGQILEVKISDGEPLSNLPGSVEKEGHKVLRVYKEEQFYKILIQRS